MRNQGENHLPNNPIEEAYGLGLSEEEWGQVLEGKPLDSFNLIPWLYEHLGLKCEKRRPPPPPPEGEGEGELDEEAKAQLEAEKKKQEELKKKEDAKKKKKDKKKDKKKKQEEEDEPEQEEEEEEPLEDIPIAEIDLMVEDEETLKKPFVGGFIMLGFPQTAEHIEKLKAAEIGFDKIIFLTDTDEENPGVVLKQRKHDDDLFDLQYQQENSERLVNIYREQYEDIVNDIS